MLPWSGFHCSQQQHPLTESNSQAPNHLERKNVEMLKSGSVGTFVTSLRNFIFFCAQVPVLRRLFLFSREALLLLAHVSFEFCPEFMAYLLFKFDDRLFH